MRRTLADCVAAAYRRKRQKPETRSAILADRQSGYGKHLLNCWGSGEIGSRVSLGNFRSHDHAGSNPVSPTNIV